MRFKWYSMEVCLLCKQQFVEKRGLKEHYNKKQSCVPQKKVLELYRSLHKLIQYKKEIDYSEHKDKNEINCIFDTIESTISGVELNPIYSKLNEFGKEDHKNIKDVFRKIERAGENAFKIYVKSMYCDRKNPENRTIKVTSMSGVYCKVFHDDEWGLECFEEVMLRIAKGFWDMMSVSENDEIQDYLLFIYEVVKKKDSKAIKKYISYCKKFILPFFYNETKRDKEFSYLVHNKSKKKAVRKKG